MIKQLQGQLKGFVAAIDDIYQVLKARPARNASLGDYLLNLSFISLYFKTSGSGNMISEPLLTLFNKCSRAHLFTVISLTFSIAQVSVIFNNLSSILAS